MEDSGLKIGFAAVVVSIAIAVGCARRQELAGTINADDFVIPAGQTFTAIGDLTINGTHRIQIDGSLYAVPGANLEFNSPIVKINGRVQNLAQHVSWWRERLISLRSAKFYSWLQRLDPFYRPPRYWPGRKILDCFGFSAAASTPPDPSPNRPADR
ncbi:MAG: hypothetical protein ACLPZJ_11775 [Terriglobales bacterium]